MALRTGPALDDAAIADLSRRFRGALIRPGDAPYEAGRRIWNGAIDRRPALIARLGEFLARLATKTDLVAVHSMGASGLGQEMPVAVLSAGKARTPEDARAAGLPVVLVVGMRLGCLNHALLTAEAIAARELVFAGWVANAVDADMAMLDENIEALRQRIAAPLLGVVPHMAQADAREAAKCLNLELLEQAEAHD